MNSEKWSAVILAGGLGSRLSPLTAKICKPMVSVANRPMVDYAIDHLRYAGIKKIVIVVKHLGEELRNQINSTWTKEVQEELGIQVDVPKVDSLGTADAVRKVADYINTENFVVSMADIVTSFPMAEFMQYHEEKHAQSSVSMKKIDQMATKYGNTMLANDGKILRFLEKPSSEEIYLSALSGQSSLSLPIINTGIYCFSHDILEMLLKNDMMDFGHHVFPYLLENKYRLYGFLPKVDYYWLDVGNPLTYLWSNWDMLRLYGWPIQPKGVRQGKVKHVWYMNDEKPSSNVKHGDNVALGINNMYGNNMYIEELTCIGSNCRFGNSCSVTKSVIWDNCQIGNGVRIEGSVIGNNCQIGDHCFIKSETIIGPNSIIPPRTVLDSQIVPADTKYGEN